MFNRDEKNAYFPYHKTDEKNIYTLQILIASFRFAMGEIISMEADFFDDTPPETPQIALKRSFQRAYLQSETREMESREK
jgi:hypothetical protein